jgi:hypothetical protein
METEALKALVRNTASLEKGSVWPNGLGFDRRGWEFTFDETKRQWHALNRRSDKSGYGDTPADALATARS